MQQNSIRSPARTLGDRRGQFCSARIIFLIYMLNIYIEIMALSQKKLVSIYLDELQYMAFQQLVIFSHVFNEFLHVITDERRFVHPVSMEKAIERCWFWLDQERVKVVYSDDDSLKRQLLWMNMHSLGRKRINDTTMAAAYAQAGVSKIIIANPADFETLGAFELIRY